MVRVVVKRNNNVLKKSVYKQKVLNSLNQQTHFRYVVANYRPRTQTISLIGQTTPITRGENNGIDGRE